MQTCVRLAWQSATKRGQPINTRVRCFSDDAGVIMAILKAPPTKLRRAETSLFAFEYALRGVIRRLSLFALAREISRTGDILVPHNRVTVMNGRAVRGHFCWFSRWDVVAATYENVNHLCKFRKRESPHGARSIKPGVSATSHSRFDVRA